MEICGLAPSRVVGPSGVGLQAGFYESAIVRVHASGSVTVYSGTAPHGQGLDTAFAQIVADRLGTSPDLVDVVHGDTGTGPFGLGTYGSRSLAVGRRVDRALDRQGSSTRPRRSPPTSSRPRPRTSSSRTASSRSRARRTRA
jgi:carbon-monoxide dehydrogenase large subunit